MNKDISKERISVIIVEDDNQYRKILKQILNDQDDLYCMKDFPNAEDALDYIQSGDTPQVILLDIELPGMSGIDLIPKIKKISPSTRILNLTIFDDDDKIFNAICVGANGYLLKSADVQSIIKAIHETVQGGAAMTPSIAAKVLRMFSDKYKPKGDYRLTDREIEILERFVKGYSKSEIADNLFISRFTVETHIKNIYSKLHVHSQTEAVYKALKEHLV